jgi:hypothetical protein
MRSLIILAIALSLAGCVKTSTIPLARNVIQVTASAPPACGMSSARDVSIRLAAIETLKNGFDSFVILDAQSADSVRTVGRTPVTSNTYGSAYLSGNTAYGSSTTTYSGGYPIMGGSRDVSLVVHMFRPEDKGYNQAISARQFLGENWAEEMETSKFRC